MIHDTRDLSYIYCIVSVVLPSHFVKIAPFSSRGQFTQLVSDKNNDTKNKRHEQKLNWQRACIEQTMKNRHVDEYKNKKYSNNNPNPEPWISFLLIPWRLLKKRFNVSARAK